MAFVFIGNISCTLKLFLSQNLELHEYCRLAVKDLHELTSNILDDR